MPPFLVDILMSCIFREIAAGREPANILFQNEIVLVFLALEGHPLVVLTCSPETSGVLS